MKAVNFSELWDQLAAERKSTFTVDDVAARIGANANAIYAAIKYAIDRQRLFSPVRGLYLIVPAEHRNRSWTSCG